MVVEFQKVLFTLSLQTLSNHKTGDDNSKVSIKMARAGNTFMSAFIVFDSKSP
jgi:hypothetical protein